MTLRLTNTLTRTTEPFSPARPDHVTMYVCGPTVYNFAHIGNARPAVVFDVLYRLLKRRFGRVVYARNFTDVDDKINAAAKERATYKAALRDAGGLLGLLQQDPAAWFGQPTGEDGDTATIQRLVEARLAARAGRDYATADRIRTELAALGITVEDRADGSAWRRTG